ncbi:hypothetical protein KLP28_02745 [Nocardioidaceae bacterium]|nr:hypothetical protein KLP28_02745 [Nocardioidaceae bacterium]
MRLPTWHTTVLSVVVVAIGLLIGLSVGLAGVATAAAHGAVLSPRYVDARVPVDGLLSGREGVGARRTDGCGFVAPPGGATGTAAGPRVRVLTGEPARTYAVCESAPTGSPPVGMPGAGGPAREVPLTSSR